ncbi:hypothetical protein LTR22_027590 [Elasticomyces elasticus]|nr:hypothetical protein LTR22_027590 [Elasticomyces elasticus]
MGKMKTYNFEDRLRRLEHGVLQNSTASASVTTVKPSLAASNILHAADGGDVGEDVFEVEDSSALPLHTRAEGMNEHDNMYTGTLTSLSRGEGIDAAVGFYGLSEDPWASAFRYMSSSGTPWPNEYRGWPGSSEI